MEITQTNSQKPFWSTVLNFGFMIGIIYCILIFCENEYFYDSPITFSVGKFIGYLIVLAMLVFCALSLKKSNGGYITFKELLKGLLVVILILELFYLIFNIIYIKYISPEFFTRMKMSWNAYFVKHNVPQENIQDAMKRFDEGGKVTFLNSIQSYGFSIVIDAIFAIIIAAIVKKKKPEFMEGEPEINTIG